MYKKSIFIFRRSLRLTDNSGLIQALKQSEKVIPIFIFTQEQVVKNSYKSNNAIQFMIESLRSLDDELKKVGSRLFYFFGTPDSVIQKLIRPSRPKGSTNEIDAIFVNRDYTPYSQKRDKKIAAICKKHNTAFNIYEDILLNPVGSILTGSETPFKKYTPYYNKARKKRVPRPARNIYKNYISQRTKITGEFKISTARFYTYNDTVAVNGGRKKARAILRSIKKFKDYDKQRNFLSYHTTLLSAYIKFGCVSIREVFHTITEALNSKDLIRQLYWRDFYYNVAHFFPHVFGSAMKEQYENITWENEQKLFEQWKQGKTGIPIVDACMHELNSTGFMHNRGRLITSNVLIKIFLVDWRKGEKYFAQKLVDYDPCVNNGNWQWSASTGADSQPYFRIFNPWIQSKKFDSSCTYIKKWLPELADVKNSDIHNWYKKYTDYPETDYPKPIVAYDQRRKKALKMYKKH